MIKSELFLVGKVFGRDVYVDLTDQLNPEDKLILIRDVLMPKTRVMSTSCAECGNRPKQNGLLVHSPMCSRARP